VATVRRLPKPEQVRVFAIILPWPQRTMWPSKIHGQHAPNNFFYSRLTDQEKSAFD
jgi:hypothetical protein